MKLEKFLFSILVTMMFVLGVMMLISTIGKIEIAIWVLRVWVVNTIIWVSIATIHSLT